MCVVKSHVDQGGGSLVAKLCPTLVAPWTVAHQAPLSMEFPRQEYWRGLPFSSPWDLPNPGIEPRSPVLQADSLLTSLDQGDHCPILLCPECALQGCLGPGGRTWSFPGSCECGQKN